MALLKECITAIRNIRGEMNLPPKKDISVLLKPQDQDMRKILEDNRIYITDSTVASELRIIDDQDEAPKPAARAFPARTEVHVPLAGLIDLDKERERLEKALGKAEKEISSHDGKLANESFISKAPADVVEMTRKRREELAQKAEKLKESLRGLN